MSVINNVLKDLETRESRFTPIEITSVAPQPATRRDLKPTALVTLLLLLLVAGGWIYLQQPSMPVVVAPISLVASDSMASLPAKTDNDPVDAVIEAPIGAETVGAGIVTDQTIGNQIVGLQIRESEQEMRLEFVLREKVVAYLKERRENSFGYHLRDIESQIVAPEISDNPWITDLTMIATAQGVDIQFDTTSEILVETRQNLVDGEPVWTIKLRKAVARPVAQPVVASVVATESKTAEPPALSESLPEGTAPVLIPQQAEVTETEPLAQAPLVKLEIKSTNPDVKSANQLEYAVELINSRRYADAENLLQGLLTGVEDHSARQHLLALYQNQQHAERFNHLARESVTRYPQDAVFRTEYGRSLFQGADYREVIQLFADKTRLDPGQQALLAASYQRLDEHANAIRHYRLALKLDANNAKNWIGLGISQEHSAKLEAALASYQRAGRLGNLNKRLQAFVDQRSATLEQVLN
ncbi:MAG: hypothetical protein GY802_01080 [Gammaproteobacteria bacterium]|nr:hypothetical protein [Gammaproteobacteria bacterium]